MTGKTIGQYRIVEKIGEGAMGVVFRARQESLQRDVALKLLPSHLALQENALARFQREATAIARIAHPNIVQVIDIGEDNGRHYIAMEFIEGRTLEQLLKDTGPMPIRDAVHVVAQVASALGAAHAQGIIHRDVKPSNILVNDKLFAKLTDFGVAGLGEGGGDSRLTMTMAAVGTPYYMSPEQVRGRDVLDGSSDVYAAGVLLYEMLAGLHPFGDSTPTEAMMQQVSEPYPPLRRYRDGVPEDLVAILQRCLSKEKGARYANGQALFEALDKIRLRLDFETLGAEQPAGDYNEEATGTGFFYVDPAARRTWRRKATIRKVAREAWAQLTDPHRRQRRKLGQLYAASMVSRDAMKSLEAHIEELRKRQAHHEQKASEARRLAQDHVTDGRGDEASEASEQESFHAKMALDYEQQIDRAGRDASSHREAYHRLKKEHDSAADTLALLDSKATGNGRCIPVGHEDAKLSSQGRRLLLSGMFMLIGLAIVAGSAGIRAMIRPVSSPPAPPIITMPEPVRPAAVRIEPAAAVLAPPQVDAPVAPDLRKGLVAYYSFTDDEGNRVSDQSDMKREGKVVDAQWIPDGKVGGAMRFGPDLSYVVATDDGLPMGDAPRSIAFWMKLGENRNYSNPVAYGSLRPNQSLTLGMDWRLGRNSICVGMHGVVNVAKPKLETDRWYHVVYTYGGRNDHRFYIDGISDNLAVRETGMQIDTTSSGKLYIGSGGLNADHAFDGWLDEVMLFDRALTDSEITQLYEQGGTKTQMIDLGNGVPLEMVWIPPGRFRMGSTQAERDWAVGAEGKGIATWYTDESDPVDINMTNGFWMGKTPVTMAMFRRFIEATGYRTDAEKSGMAWGWNSSYVFGAAPGISWRTPGFAQQDNHPVVCVSWADAMAFCEWLTRIERDAGRLPAGKEFRLPGEAEWEYGARGGREGTKFWWGDELSDGRGRLNGAGTDKLPNGTTWPAHHDWEDGFAFTSPVDYYGASGRNGFGLADMLGNVWQWCYDRYDRKGAHGSIFRGNSSYGVLRGGAFDSCRGGDLRCANRGPDDPPMPLAHRGFRVVLADDVDAPAQVGASVKPATGGLQWEDGVPFPVACGMLAATVADGSIYAMGGYNGRWNSHVYRYNPAQPEQGWQSLSNMPMGRACLAVVTAGGRIYSIGGQGTENDPAAVFAYDWKQPEQGWSQVSSLPVGLSWHTAVPVSGKIYVMGGLGTTGAQSAVYAYDTQKPDQGWRYINSMPVALSSLAATVLDGKIYVIGGCNPAGFSSAVYAFDTLAPERGWSDAGRLPQPRYNVAAVTAGKRIYAVGGFNDRQQGIASVYMYDSLKPDQGWVAVTDLPEVKGEAPGVVVDGKFYVISGAVAPCSYRRSVYVGTVAAEQ